MRRWRIGQPGKRMASREFKKELRRLFLRPAEHQEAVFCADSLRRVTRTPEGHSQSEIIAAGIDWGPTGSYVVITGWNFGARGWRVLEAVAIGTGEDRVPFCDQLELCARILRRSRPSIIVDDANGPGWGAHDVLRREFSTIPVLAGRIATVRCEWNNRWYLPLEDQSEVQINKPQAAFLISRAFEDRQVQIDRGVSAFEDFIQHHQNMIRSESERYERVFAPGRKSDHFFDGHLLSVVGGRMLSRLRIVSEIVPN